MKPSTVDSIVAGGLDPTDVMRVIRTALDEDLGPDRRDLTSLAAVPGDQTGTGDLVARAGGVVAGVAVAAAVFESVDPRVAVTSAVADGARVERDDLLATVTGPVRALLTAERTALNLLCRLSGVATRTRAWADELCGTGAQVLDTRKTTPGLRALEKYAVRVGGGANKRMGLYDVAMIKDNHVRAAGGVAPAFARVRAAYPDLPVQVEVTSVAEAVAAVEAGARFLLCDNLPPEALREVVAAVAGRAELEATGNLTLEHARKYAGTGVDYLSVGAITHSAPILDIAMDLRGR
jgi:nicotinate-nucleotide pyrophosphorylase (carboxylating)